MRNNFLVKAVAILLSLVTLLGLAAYMMPMSVSAETTEEKGVSRLINIVYDDSNSMLESGKLWWCYAKYSLEVFSAMMQDDDKMNIYFMSDFMSDTPNSQKKSRLTLSGERSKQQANIDEIHKVVPKTRGTPFASLQTAYGDLKNDKGGYDERWMVVITDGDSFDNKETAADIDNLFNDCAGYNINVIYLAIGSALVPTQNTNKGIHVYKADGNDASGNDGILSKVTQICQQIFQRPSMETAVGGKLKLDIPASEIIVFAQGANASVGNLSGAKRNLATVSMKETDKATVNPTWVSQVKSCNLNACIATFTPSTGKYIPEGTYDLNIQAEEYIVYYKPALDVALELYDTNGNKATDKYIPIGSYSLKYWLTYPVGHPKHGEKLDQNLFSVDYSLTCTVDGVRRELNSNNIDLGGGSTEIRVVAHYLNFSSTDASLKYVVEDFTINEIDVDVEYNQQDYRLSTLETQNEGFVIRVTRNGNPIPAAEWEPFVLDIGIENPEFKVVKNSDSTFTVYPKYSAAGKTATATGDIEFKATVSASNDHRVTDRGSCDVKINIYDDITAVPLGVTIDEQSTPCDNKNFADQDSSRKVTIDWDGKPLTKEQYDALAVAVEIEENKYYSARIELDPYVEGEPTTATVYFDLIPDENGNPPEYKKLQGTKEFTVTASVEREGVISEGSAESELKVNDARTIWELLMDYLPIIIALLILLFLLLAYLPIIKRYLPMKSRYTSAGYPHTVRWYKNATAIITLILPFVRVRSSANLQISAVNSMQISVKALGAKRAVCTNKQQLQGMGYNVTQNINLRSSAISRGGRTVITFRR